MTARPEDLQRRLRGLDQIADVVGALRAIASGQAVGARGAMPAIAAHAATLAQAMAQIGAAAPAVPQPQGPGLLLVVGAEQGFSGTYPARLAEAAQQALLPGTGVLAVGHRTLGCLQDLGITALWSDALIGHPAAVPGLASRITDTLIGLSGAYPGPIRALVGQHGAAGAGLRQIFPPERPPEGAATRLPLMTLAPAALLEGLLREALFAAVALALMQGLEAEAAARVSVLARARTNLTRRRAEVETEWQQARQDQMTTEMIELSSARGEG